MIKTFNTQNWRHITDLIYGTPVYQVNFPLLKGTIYYVLRLYTEGGDGMNKLYFEHELYMWVIYSESFTPVILTESLRKLLPKFFLLAWRSYLRIFTRWGRGASEVVTHSCMQPSAYCGKHSSKLLITNCTIHR